MKYIINIIKNLISKEMPKPLGRWRIENCNKQVNNKIDLSNEDHCGPCGQYALEKIELKHKIKNNKKIDK
jgi:hypothetical protein